MRSERQKKLDWYANATKRRIRYKVFAISVSALVLSLQVLLMYYS